MKLQVGESYYFMACGCQVILQPADGFDIVASGVLDKHFDAEDRCPHCGQPAERVTFTLRNYEPLAKSAIATVDQRKLLTREAAE